MKYKTILLLLLTAAVIAAGSGRPRLSPWDAWRMAYTSFEKGEIFREKGDYTKAKESFDQALEYYQMVRKSRPDWNQKVITERIADCEKESRRMTAFLGPSARKERESGDGANAPSSMTEGPRELALRRELSELKAELEELRRRNEVRKNYESEISNLLRDQRTLQERYTLLEKRFRAQAEKASLPDEKVKSLESQLITMRLQLDLARKESAAAQKRSEAADAGRIALQEEKKQMDNARRQLKGEVESLQRKLQQLEKRNSLLSRNLASAQKRIEQQDTLIGSEKDQQKKIRRELDELQIKYREKLAASGAGETANRKLLEENQRLQTSLTSLRNAEQESARQNAALQRDIEKIRLQLSEEISKHSAAAVQLKEKNNSLNALNTELQREKSAAAILSRELENMRNNANSSSAELKKLISETTELRRRLKFREGEDFKNLTAARSDRDRLQKELHKYEEQLAVQRADSKMKERKVSALERSLKEMQTENRKLHAERINYEDRFKALTGASANAQELARRYSELKANFTALQAENRQNKLAAEAAKPREAELARIKLRLAELDGLKQQLRREQSFNEQLNAVKSRLEKELRQLRPMGTENAALKAKLADHTMLKKEVERLRKLSAELAGAQKLSGEIAELKMQLAQTQPLADEATRLRRQNQELIQGRVLWENEIAKMKLQLASMGQLQQQTVKLRAELAQKEKALQKASRDHENLSAENRELSRKASALQSLRQRTAQLIADQAKTIEMLRNAEGEIRRLKADAETAAASAAATIAAAQTQIQEQTIKALQAAKAVREAQQAAQAAKAALETLRAAQAAQAAKAAQEAAQAAQAVLTAKAVQDVTIAREAQAVQEAKIAREALRAQAEQAAKAAQAVKAAREAQAAQTAKAAQAVQEAKAAREALAAQETQAAQAARAAQEAARKHAAAIAELRRENTLLKSVNAKNVNLEQTLAEVRISNTRMRAKLEQLPHLKAELTRLSSALKKSQFEQEKFKGENDRLLTVASEVRRIENENSRIVQLNKELSNRSLKAESELASLKSELANYNRLRTEAERLRKLTVELADARNLAPALAQAKLQIARLEQMRDELNRQRTLNEELVQKRAALEKELAARPMPAFAPADYTPAASLKPLGKAEDYISAGRLADANEKDELAVWNYRTALKLDPDNYTAAELLGKLLALRGDYAEAAPLLSRARNAKPDSIDLALETANAYISLKRYGNAEAIIEPLLKRNQENPDLQIAAGLIAAGNGQYAKASGLLMLAAARAPKDPRPKLELARLIYNTDPNRIFEAVKFYESARSLGAPPDLDLEPKLAPMLNKRSNMTKFLTAAAAEAARSRDWNNVIWYNRQLIELDREPEKYRPRVAFAQYKKGSSGAALETLSMGNITPLGLLVKAYIHLQRKEEREALLALNQAKSLNHNQLIELPADWTEFLLDFRKYGKSLAPYTK